MTVVTTTGTEITLMDVNSDLKQAFNKLKICTSEGQIKLWFELKHDHSNGYTGLGFFAMYTSCADGYAAYEPSAIKAVNRLLAKLRITTVEQYIRMKGAQS